MNMILLALTLAGVASAEERLLAQVGVRAPHMGMGALNRMFDAQPLRKELKTAVPEQDLVVDVPEPPKEYRRTFRLLVNNPEKTDRYDRLIIDNADKHALDPRLVKSIIAAESEFTIQARSPKGARGLMQVMPKTASQHGVSPDELYTAEGSVAAGTSYLAWLFKTAWKRWKLKGVAYRDAPMWILQRIIAAYNAGPKFLTKRPWFKETKHYVRKVVMYYKSKVSDLRRPPENRYAYPKVTMAPSSAGLLF
jgi:hypothetical protein